MLLRIGELLGKLLQLALLPLRPLVRAYPAYDLRAAPNVQQVVNAMGLDLNLEERVPEMSNPPRAF